MIKRGIAVMTFAIGLLCCDNIKEEKSEKELSIPARVLYPQDAVPQLLDSLHPPVQHFSIHSERDTVVIGSNGILIAIGGNTFINAEEELVTGKIDLTLVEVQSLPEIIGAGLQTTAGDDILQTAGMIFIDARSNGESLEISEGKAIVVSMSSQRAFTNAKVFAGEFDNDGHIDWKKVSCMEKDLIPFPVELLDFNDGAWECWYTDEQLKFLQDTKFKNTFVHSREFERRMHVFNYYATCPQMKDLDDEIIKIYTENTQKNLFYADSLVALHLMNNYSGIIDTTKVFEFDNVGWMSLLYQSALQFAQERLGKPLNFEELRIDGNLSIKRLTDRGYSETEATHILNLYNIREQTIKSRKDRTKVRETQAYVFSISTLGWINVDRFLTDENASESKFTVEIKSKDSLDVFAVSLLIPTYSVALSAMDAHDNTFSFTNKEDGYRKLPVGEDAFLVAISYKNNKSYFGKQKIKIPKDGQIEITMEKANQDQIKREIANLLN